jgi:hypothetical protein
MVEQNRLAAWLHLDYGIRDIDRAAFQLLLYFIKSSSVTVGSPRSCEREVLHLISTSTVE